MRPRTVVSLASLGFLALLGSSPAVGSCNTGNILHGLTTTSFEQCGPDAHAFFWVQGRALQGTLGAPNSLTAGHDSGRNQTEVEGMYFDGPNGGKSNGSYYGSTGWGNPGVDGCILIFREADPGCAGGPDFGITNYAISGVDPQQPNLARLAVLSVDFNEFFQAWVLDNAGAPSVDGDPCGEDGLSFNPNPVNCAPIPMPTLDGSSVTEGGTLVTVGIGSTAGIPILDDCLVAEDRATNCPRNLYAGRALLFKHGACTVETGASFDHRVYIYPADPASGTLTVFPNWNSYSPEDANLNGLLDAGEDGSHGGTVNGRLDPLVIPGTDATSVDVLIPAVPGASDCIFLALGVLLDDHHLDIDPSGNTILGETVISPEVSVNPNPIKAGSTLISDNVSSITAVKKAGSATIAWHTVAELHTHGYNVIGIKANGRELTLNANLIPAKQGTTGEDASYTATFDAGQLKGVSSVLIELVKTDGTSLRFGPAGF